MLATMGTTGVDPFCRLISRKDLLRKTLAFVVSFQLPASISALPSLSQNSTAGSGYQFIFPQPERLIAVGDLHGDMKATRDALRIAGVLHPSRDDWVGGATVVVQVGDQLDRGDDELEVLSLLHRLRIQAFAAGGAVHVLAGNHETMNARGNSRYATDGAKRRFNRWATVCQYKALLPRFIGDANHCGLYTSKPACSPSDEKCIAKVTAMAPYERSRFLALKAGGPVAKDLFAKERFAVIVVGDTVFVHGGLTKADLSAGNSTEKLHKLNADFADFMSGRKPGRKGFSGERLLWNRDYSARSEQQLKANPRACHELNETLALLPGGRVRRMVVGHTVQRDGTITSACNGGVWRVDIGMSRGVKGARPQVLQIGPDGTVRVLSGDACGDTCPRVLTGGSAVGSWLRGAFSAARDAWQRLPASSLT